MASPALLASWFQYQKAKAPSMRNAPVFYRNLEEALDLRRGDRTLMRIRSGEAGPDSIDFSSLDILSLASSGIIRKEFLEELARHPDFSLGSGGSRLLDGNNTYIESTERDIAEFHNAETALLVHSGWEANVCLMAAIPRPGDAIVYDELIHSSFHEGMQLTLAPCKMSFKHNDVDDFRETLLKVLETQPLIKQGTKCVIICVESMYSMDGDCVALKELVDVAKEMFPKGNAQFIVDEAHTTGSLGHQGRGLVCELGLEKEIAIRMYTYGKAMATTGGAILCNQTVRAVLANNAKSIIYSTSPSFPTIAAIRAGYALLRSGKTQPLQDQLQHIVRHFFKTVAAHPLWETALDEGIISIPLIDDWESRPFVTHVVPIMTRQRYNFFLFYHLQLSKMCAFPIDYPVVPKGQSRVRLVFHANNTEAEIEQLVGAIFEWVQEMIDLEASGKGGAKVPSAARQVFACHVDA